MSTKFNVGDRVEIIGSVPGVWIVQNVIVTPPPRWEENGTSKVSYCLFGSIQGSGHRDSVEEDSIRLAVNPLISQVKAFARINRTAAGKHHFTGWDAQQIEDHFRKRHPKRFR